LSNDRHRSRNLCFEIVSKKQHIPNPTGTALGVKHHGFPIDFSRFSQQKITKELLEWLPSSRRLTGRPLDLRLLRAMLLQLPRQLRSGPETRQRLCLGFMVGWCSMVQQQK